MKTLVFHDRVDKKQQHGTGIGHKASMNREDEKGYEHNVIAWSSPLEYTFFISNFSKYIFI